MGGLFLRILNMSLTASALCAAVLVLRALFRGKLPRWLFYGVWGLVLLRLLLPFSPPSRASVFNAIPAARPAASEAAPVLNFVEETGAAVSFPTLQTRRDDPAEPDHRVIAPAPVAVTTILASIWLCGAALLLAYSAGCYLYTMRRLRRSRQLEHTPELDALFLRFGVKPGRVRLYVSDLFDSPVVCGLFRPRLILSGLVTREDLQNVVAHELTHIRRHDNLWKALATLALYLHWFNPLLWYCYRSYVTDMETSCDEAVVRSEQCDRKAYASSLLNMAVRSRSAFAGGFLAFGECALKERVKSIMNVKKYAVIVTIICIAMIAGLAVVFLTNPQTLPSAAPPVSDAVSSEPSDAEAAAPPPTESASSSQPPASSSEAQVSEAPAQSSSGAGHDVPAEALTPTPILPASSQEASPQEAKELPPQQVAFWKDNPGEFCVELDRVDCLNLVDRDRFTSFTISDEKGKAELINLLNSYKAKKNTTDTPDMSGLRLLQIRYRDGSKQEYWCHNNLIMVGDTAYKMTEKLRALYSELDRILAANRTRMGAEWIGLMNPYRISKMNFTDAQQGSGYVSNATDEQRDAILDVAGKLKALTVDPSSATQRPKGSLPDLDMKHVSIRLIFDDVKSVYYIRIFEDGLFSLWVDNIDYSLSYETYGAQNPSFVSLWETLQKYQTESP